MGELKETSYYQIILLDLSNVLKIIFSFNILHIFIIKYRYIGFVKLKNVIKIFIRKLAVRKYGVERANLMIKR